MMQGLAEIKTDIIYYKKRLAKLPADIYNTKAGVYLRPSLLSADGVNSLSFNLTEKSYILD